MRYCTIFMCGIGTLGYAFCVVLDHVCAVMESELLTVFFKICTCKQSQAK